MTKLIVCPNDVKIKILEDNSKNNELVNIKFMTKVEFLQLQESQRESGLPLMKYLRQIGLNVSIR